VSLGGGVLASGSVWKDLSACVDLTIDYGAASDRDPQAKSKSEQIQSDVEAYSWPDCPWLFSLFEASANGGKVDASSRPHGHVQVADTNVDDVMDALNVAREYWALQAPPQENDFKWRLLGGKWTADHTNVCYDAFSGYAATAAAKQFCARRSMNKIGSFYISRYTEAHAFELALFWVARMQHFLDVERAKGVHHIFTGADLASFIEPARIQELAVGHGVVHDRILQIRGTMPR